MEPIEYERIKIERYEKVIENLDLLREAQLTHKEAYGYYASDIDYLEDFHRLRFRKCGRKEGLFFLLLQSIVPDRQDERYHCVPHSWDAFQR